MNESLFDAALIAAVRECGRSEVEYYLSLPLVEHTFSHKHQKHMNRIFRREKYDRLINGMITVSRRVAAVILVACTIMFGAAISVEAVRDEIWQAFTTFWGDYFTFGATSRYSNDELTANEYRMPTWLPAGYTEINRLNGEGFVSLIYANDTGEIMEYCIYLYKEKTIAFNQERMRMIDVTVNGMNGEFCMYKKNDNLLIWYDDSYCYYLYGVLDQNEMMKIANSIK